MTWVCYDIASESSCRMPAEEQLLESLADHAYDDHAIFSVRLAFDEAVANAIKHGNKMDPSKRVSIRMDVDAERAIIEVEDQGNGFCDGDLPDPRAAQNIEKPHGRGVMLMKAYMDEVKYEKCGRLVRMVKYREGVSKSPRSDT